MSVVTAAPATPSTRRRLLPRLAVYVLGLIVSGLAWSLATVPAQALCVGSSICNPANAPLLADLSVGAGGVAPVAGTAVATGSTATSTIAVASGSAGAMGSTLSSALGGTAGVALLGGGIAAWQWTVGQDAPIPEHTTGTGTGPALTGIGVCGKNPGTGVVYTRVNPPSYSGCLPYGPMPTMTVSGQVVSWSASATVTIQRTIQVACYSPVTYAQTFATGPVVSLVGSQNTSEAGTSGSATCGAGTVPGLKVFENGNSTGTGYPTLDSGTVYLNVSTTDSILETTPRTIDQTVTCKDSAGVVSTQTASVTIPDALPPGATVPVAGLQCPDGQRLVKVVRVVKTPGQPDVAFPELNVPPETGIIPAPCFSASVGCRLQLQRLDLGSWTADIPSSLAWPDVQADPGRYRCRMGDGGSVAWVAVPLRWCKANFDYPDPSSPPNRKRDTDPVADDPISSVAPQPPAAPDPNSPNPNPSQGDCDLGWSDLFTGAVFVKGSKCVLQWAFVPTPVALYDLSTRLNVAVGSTAPAAAAAGVSGFVAPVSAWSSAPVDCMGPEVDIPAVGIDSWYPFQACSGLSKTMSDWWLPLATVVVYITAAFVGVRMVLRTIGAPSHLDGEGES